MADQSSHLGATSGSSVGVGAGGAAASATAGSAGGSRRAGGTRERNLGLDTARILAAFGTVWIHSVQSDDIAPWGEVGRFAVPFFCVTAAILLVETLYANPSRTTMSYGLQRLGRLYLPFLVWTGIYLLARWLKHAALGFGQPIVLLPSMAVNGSAHHLWFLPALAIWTWVAFPIVKALMRSPRLAKPAAVTIFVVAAIWARVYSPVTEVSPGVVGLAEFPRLYDAVHRLDVGLPYFVDQNLRRFPCFLAGIALALFFGPLQRLREGVQTTSAWTGVFCTAACMLEVAAIGRNSLLAMIAGLGWTIAAYGRWAPVWLPRVIGRLGRLSFGVYLVHVLFCEALQSVGKRLDMPETWWFDLAVFFSSSVGSLLLVWALRQFRVFRWLVPG